MTRITRTALIALTLLSTVAPVAIAEPPSIADRLRIQQPTGPEARMLTAMARLDAAMMAYAEAIFDLEHEVGRRDMDLKRLGRAGGGLVHSRARMVMARDHAVRTVTRNIMGMVRSREAGRRIAARMERQMKACDRLEASYKRARAKVQTLIDSWDRLRRPVTR